MNSNVILKILGAIRCNAEVVIMFVVRDLLLGALATFALLALMASAEVWPDDTFKMYVGITLGISMILGMREVLKHKREKYGTVEGRQFMTPRLRAQLHDIVMTATTYLIVGILFIIMFLYGLAKYLLSGFITG